MTEILRRTESICPECFQKIPAEVVIEENEVYLRKRCDRHGPFRVRLSRKPDYYRQLNNSYFKIIPHEIPQKDYIVRLTERCNMMCPICLARSNERSQPDYSLDKLRAFLKRKKNYKLDLMGAEPTMRDDLFEIIEMVSASGNIGALHTNGLKLADREYVERLKEAGLNEVHLQFDGFDEEANRLIRGMPLNDIHARILQNLEEFDLPTDLVVTVLRGVNEKEVGPVLDYAIAHPFVKEVFYLGCRYLGRAISLEEDPTLMPDEVVDIFTSQRGEVVNRSQMLNFQKAYYLLLRMFNIRKCHYIQHHLLVRTKKGVIALDKLIGIEKFNRLVNKLEAETIKHGRVPPLRAALAGVGLALNPHLLSILKDILKVKLSWRGGLNLSTLPRHFLLLGFISACDPYTFDYQIAPNCGKGEISEDLGVQHSGALANVLREMLYRREIAEKITSKNKEILP